MSPDPAIRRIYNTFPLVLRAPKLTRARGLEPRARAFSLAPLSYFSFCARSQSFAGVKTGQKVVFDPRNRVLLVYCRKQKKQQKHNEPSCAFRDAGGGQQADERVLYQDVRLAGETDGTGIRQLHTRPDRRDGRQGHDKEAGHDRRRLPPEDERRGTSLGGHPGGRHPGVDEEGGGGRREDIGRPAKTGRARRHPRGGTLHRLPGHGRQPGGDAPAENGESVVGSGE